MVWISWGEQPKQGKGKRRTRERKKKQEVRFSTKIHSMGTRKWIWKTLYTLHLKHLFYGEGSEVEWVECNRLRRLSVKVQFKRVTVTKREKKKSLLSSESWHSDMKKKVLMLEMQNYYKMLRSKSFFFFLTEYSVRLPHSLEDGAKSKCKCTEAQKNKETEALRCCSPSIQCNNSDPHWKMKLNCDPILRTLCGHNKVR